MLIPEVLPFPGNPIRRQYSKNIHIKPKKNVPLI